MPRARTTSSKRTTRQPRSSGFATAKAIDRRSAAPVAGNVLRSAGQRGDRPSEAASRSGTATDIAARESTIAKTIGNEEELASLAKSRENEEELQKAHDSGQVGGAGVSVDVVRDPGPPARARTSAQLVDALGKARVRVRSGAAASIALGARVYGLTFPESVDVDIRAVRRGASWHPRVTRLTGHYSMQSRLLPGQSEVTGPRGNTTRANFCAQVNNLANLGNVVGNPWYMLEAVDRHERVHAKRFKPALKDARRAIVTAVEAVSVPHAAGMRRGAAAAGLTASADFAAAVAGAQPLWLGRILPRVAGDHAAGGPTERAEHKVVDPMRRRICGHARRRRWGACPQC